MSDTRNELKGFQKWVDTRLPVFSFINHNLRDYPTPKNLSYFWNFGSLAGITLIIMIVTAIAYRKLWDVPPSSTSRSFRPLPLTLTGKCHASWVYDSV